MSIIDELAEMARERHFGHETSNTTERVLCRISRIPEAWCHGCRRGLHRHTRLPLPGAEEDFELPVAEVVAVEVAPTEITPVDVTPPEVEALSVKFTDVDLSAGPVEGVKKIWAGGELVYDALAQSLKDGVDAARDPNYCPRCTPQGWGSCRCDRASNE